MLVGGVADPVDARVVPDGLVRLVDHDHLQPSVLRFKSQYGKYRIPGIPIHLPSQSIHRPFSYTHLPNPQCQFFFFRRSLLSADLEPAVAGILAAPVAVEHAETYVCNSFIRQLVAEIEKRTTSCDSFSPVSNSISMTSDYL